MLVKPFEFNKEAGTLAENETLSLAMRGTLSGGAGLGFYVCGRVRCGERNPLSGVYSMRRSGYNQYTNNSSLPRYTVWYKKTHSNPTNPRTAAQQLRRTAYRNALDEWALLTDYQKDLLNRQGNKEGITGLNLFIRKVLQNLS